MAYSYLPKNAGTLFDLPLIDTQTPHFREDGESDVHKLRIA